MPIYDYRCEVCNNEFTVQTSMAEHDKQQIVCPQCKSSTISQHFSTFFAKTSKKS